MCQDWTPPKKWGYADTHRMILVPVFDVRFCWFFRAIFDARQRTPCWEPWNAELFHSNPFDDMYVISPLNNFLFSHYKKKKPPFDPTSSLKKNNINNSVVVLFLPFPGRNLEFGFSNPHALLSALSLAAAPSKLCPPLRKFTPRIAAGMVLGPRGVSWVWVWGGVGGHPLEKYRELKKKPSSSKLKNHDDISWNTACFIGILIIADIYKIHI